MSRLSCPSILCTPCSLPILLALCSFYHFLFPIPSASPSVWTLSLRLLSGSKSLHGSQMRSNKSSLSPPPFSPLPSTVPVSFPGDSICGLNFLNPTCLTPLQFGFSAVPLLKLLLPRLPTSFQTQWSPASLHLI